MCGQGLTEAWIKWRPCLDFLHILPLWVQTGANLSTDEKATLLDLDFLIFVRLCVQTLTGAYIKCRPCLDFLSILPLWDRWGTNWCKEHGACIKWRPCLDFLHILPLWDRWGTNWSKKTAAPCQYLLSMSMGGGGRGRGGMGSKIGKRKP